MNTKTSLFCILLVHLICFLPTSSWSNSFNPENSQVLLGTGFNSLTEKVRGDCIAYTKKGSLIRNGGQTSSISITLVNSRTELRKSLGVSANASLNLGAFKGSVKASYARDTQFNSYYVYLVISVKVVNQIEVIKNVTLKSWALKKLNKDKSSFMRSCGNQFISSVQTGGELLVVLQAKTSNSKEKQKVAASLLASGIAWRAEGKVRKEFSKLVRDNSITFDAFRKGDDGTIKTRHDSVKGVLNYAYNFPKVVMKSGKPVPVLVHTKDYIVLQNYPTKSPIKLSRKKIVLRELASRVDYAREKSGDIFHILRYKERFRIKSIKKLKEQHSALHSFMNKMLKSAITCHSDYLQPKGCQLPTMSIPTVDLPEEKRGLSLTEIKLRKAKAALKKAMSEITKWKNTAKKYKKSRSRWRHRTRNARVTAHQLRTKINKKDICISKLRKNIRTITLCHYTPGKNHMYQGRRFLNGLEQLTCGLIAFIITGKKMPYSFYRSYYSSHQKCD